MYKQDIKAAFDELDVIDFNESLTEIEIIKETNKSIAIMSRIIEAYRKRVEFLENENEVLKSSM